MMNSLLIEKLEQKPTQESISGRPWRDDETKTLIKLYKEGHKGAYIGEKLNMKRTRVQQKVILLQKAGRL